MRSLHGEGHHAAPSTGARTGAWGPLPRRDWGARGQGGAWDAGPQVCIGASTLARERGEFIHRLDLPGLPGSALKDCCSSVMHLNGPVDHGIRHERLDADEGMGRDAYESVQHAGAVAPLAKGISARIPTGARRLMRANRDRRSAAVAGALIVSAALSVFLTACDHQPNMAMREAEADALRALAARADTLASEDELSGAMLIAKDGRVLFSHAYGLADRKSRIPNTLQTRFRIGSMNKMFTAVAILQLVEAGKIKLTAPLGTYLPDYPNRDVATKVTIHQLLTHTGGTGDIFGPDFDAHRNELRTLADYVKLYGKRGLEFKPGSQWAYSNYGFILLGAVIEKVTGHSYYNYVQAHIYAPAGMTRSGSLPEDQAVADRSIGYTKPPEIDRVASRTPTRCPTAAPPPAAATRRSRTSHGSRTRCSATNSSAPIPRSC